MAEINVNTDDDRATVLLARTLVFTEILAQIAAVYMVFDMVEHGALNVKFAWYWKQWKARWDAERAVQRDLRYALWQAYRVLEESRG